jgi:hypothetical protein
LQHFPGFHQLTAAGAGLYIQHFSNLLMAVTFNGTQVENNPLTIWQLID